MVDLNVSLVNYIATIHVVLWVLGGSKKQEKFANNRRTWLHTSTSRYQYKKCNTRRRRKSLEGAFILLQMCNPI